MEDLRQVSKEVIDLENNGDLAGAYRILRKQWLEGDRRRDIGLHLMYVCWYGIIEPSTSTKFTETEEEKRELNQTLFDVHTYFESVIKDDVEMLYVFGLMADMFWFMLDHRDYWEQISIDYRLRYRELAPNGLSPDIFKDRGDYGAYYGMQTQSKNGY